MERGTFLKGKAAGLGALAGRSASSAGRSLNLFPLSTGGDSSGSFGARVVKILNAGLPPSRARRIAGTRR